MNLPKEDINVKKSITEAIEDINGLLSADVILQKELDALVIHFPLIHFNSVVQNLLSNCYKYQNPEKKLSVNISHRTEDDYTVLSFSDNGIGFNSEKHAEDIFKLFKRFNTEKEGQGIGLYNIKLTMESYGGRVSINSKENIGTEVNLFFNR